MTDGGTPTPNGRLNSWKEISAHLGRSVRTCQRWEKEFALPVHRLGQGDIVYALIDEIEAWQRTPEAHTAYQQRSSLPNGARAPLQTGHVELTADTNKDLAHPKSRVQRQKHTRLVFGFVFCMAIVCLTVTGLFVAHRFWDSEPDQWGLEKGVLNIYSSHKRLLWAKSFTPAIEAFEVDPQAHLRSIKCVLIDDVDRDGHNEVFVARKKADDQYLYCLNYDGTVRFRRRVNRAYQTGQGVHMPPFMAGGVAVTDDGGPTKTIWMISDHTSEFTSVLWKLDASGNIGGEYVSNGWINALQTMKLGSRRLVLAGAVNNEHRASSLAVLDFNRITGSAPAANQEFACKDCPPGSPIAYFVFPSLGVNRALNGYGAGVNSIRVYNDRFDVLVPHSVFLIPPDAEPTGGVGIYTFDSTLTPVFAELQPEYEPTKKRLRKLGRLTVDLPVETSKDLVPILKWSDGKFVSVMVPTPSR